MMRIYNQNKQYLEMKKIFYLLFLLPLAVACGGDDVRGTTQPKEPTLELTSKATMEFDAKGGVGEITYNLVKGDEALDGESGLIGQASPIVIVNDQDWITILKDESIYGVIKFEVAANTTGEQRTGIITGKYLTKSFSVTINQAAEVSGVEGWAVVGSMTNNWDVTAAIMMEATEGYFVARGVDVAANDSFKFVKDGDMQNSLGGNGQAAERDYKYPTSKYGSDIRVKEAGTYDLYINETLDTYYVMSEGKSPAEAHEVVAPGEDVWYVSGLDTEYRMNKAGIYLVASKLSLDEDGFVLRNTILGNCGAEVEGVAELDTEIAISEESEYSIVVNYEESKLYDVYLKADAMKVWVVPAGVKPNILNECFDGEGAWFSGNKNFYIYLEAEGIKLTLDCMLAEAVEDYIIPETTFEVLFGEDRNGKNYVDSNASEIANDSGKTKIVSGTVTVKHVEGGYDISVDIVNHLQHHIRAHYTGELKHSGMIGSPIVTPGK